MSLVFNMVGGGGGGLKATDALLRVQAPAGSTVTITKGTVTKTDLGHENALDPTVYDYYFIIHASQFDSQNAWTVTATLSGGVATQTVIIDTADEYDVVFYAILPSGYTPVQYIEGAGTQRLRLDLSTAKNIFGLKIETDLMVKSSGTCSFVGDSQAAPYFIFLRVYSGGFYPAANTDGSVAGTSNTSLMNRKVHYVFDGSDGTINIFADSELWYTGTRTTKSVSAIHILAQAGAGNFYIMSGRLYRIKIYDTDHTTLLLDGYPCVRDSDSVAGLYNLATNSFMTNTGTGSFIVGE